jgi:hypothetical protein
VAEQEGEHLPPVGEVQGAGVGTHHQLVTHHVGDLGGRRRAADVLQQRNMVGALPFERREPEPVGEAGRHEARRESGLERLRHADVGGERDRGHQLRPARLRHSPGRAARQRPATSLHDRSRPGSGHQPIGRHDTTG